MAISIADWSIRVRVMAPQVLRWLSRLLLTVAAIELVTMPLTQHLWTWDHFLQGGQDFRTRASSSRSAAFVSFLLRPSIAAWEFGFSWPSSAYSKSRVLCDGFPNLLRAAGSRAAPLDRHNNRSTGAFLTRLRNLIPYHRVHVILVAL